MNRNYIGYEFHELSQEAQQHAIREYRKSQEFRDCLSTLIYNQSQPVLVAHGYERLDLNWDEDGNPILGFTGGILNFDTVLDRLCPEDQVMRDYIAQVIRDFQVFFQICALPTGFVFYDSRIKITSPWVEAILRELQHLIQKEVADLVKNFSNEANKKVFELSSDMAISKDLVIQGHLFTKEGERALKPLTLIKSHPMF